MKSSCLYNHNPSPVGYFSSAPLPDSLRTFASLNYMESMNGQFSPQSMCNNQQIRMNSSQSESAYTNFPPCVSSNVRRSSCCFSDSGSGVSDGSGSLSLTGIFQPAQYLYRGNMETNMSKESQWSRCCNLPQESLRHLQKNYTSQFPIELRHYFADWIEAQAWDQIDENDSEHMNFAIQLLDSMICQVDQLATQGQTDTQNIFFKMKFQEISRNLRAMYGSNAMEFVSVVRRCLNLEKQLLDLNEKGSISNEPEAGDKNREIMENLEKAQKMTNATEQMLKTMQNDQEIFLVQYSAQHKVTNQITQIQREPAGRERTEKERQLMTNKQTIERDLTNRARALLNSRQELAHKHQETCQALENVQKVVVDGELINWKRKQQFSGNGAPFEAHLLEEIQQWCELLAELVWKNRQQIIQTEMMRQNLPINLPEGKEDILPELNKKITGLLSSLVTSTFIVESQPPQVLKKEARFSARVRLLVGGKLNIYMTPPQVRASIISEVQARNLLRNDPTAQTATCGTIVNNEGTMEYHQQKGELSREFRNMQLKNHKRADKRGAEAVTEEKFCILFQSDFQICRELVFQVWTLSLPVVVTVHGNQECNALATVLWDNQFNEPGRQPFMVPDEVPWPKMAELLNIKFTSMCGRSLSSDNLQYLATKLFVGSSMKDDFSNRKVSWSMFNKDTMQHPSRNFTFWEWFYSIAKLTKEHLKGPWMDGSIIGFISKEGSQEVLQTTRPGTFLLRFSDSSLGGVTIAWSTEETNAQMDHAGNRMMNVWNLAPFMVKDFAIRTLADRIKDLPQLINLYPNTPKDQAFGKYFSKVDVKGIKKPLNGYISHHLEVSIESNKLAHELKKTLTFKHEQMECVGQQMMYDNPQTPATASDCNGPASPSVDDPQSPQSLIAMSDIMNDDEGDGVMLDYDFNDIVADVHQMLYQNGMGMVNGMDTWSAGSQQGS